MKKRAGILSYFVVREEEFFSHDFITFFVRRYLSKIFSPTNNWYGSSFLSRSLALYLSFHPKFSRFMKYTSRIATFCGEYNVSFLDKLYKTKIQ